MNEMRKDPTRNQWVLVCPEATPPRPDSACPFCPGREAQTPREIAAYRKEGSMPGGPGWSVRVIPEADPYFRIEWALVREGVGLYDCISGRGATELIVESPHHDHTPATMPEAQWEQVLWMWAERMRDLKRDRAIRDLLVTRRHRRPGSRITHPYSRLTAVPIVFDDVRRKLTESRDYYHYKRRCIYCDIVRQEVAEGVRVVRTTPHFVVVVPYAARAPLETCILPRLHAASYEDALSAPVAGDLAGLLGKLFRALAGPLGDPPFEMTLFSAPNRASRVAPGDWTTLAEDYHWHIEILPGWEELTRVGGIFVNEVPPEQGARRIRDAWPKDPDK